MSKSRDLQPAPPTEAAPARPEAPSLGILAHWSALPSTEDAGFITTMPLRTPADALRLQHAMAGDSVSLWKLPAGQIVAIEHVIAHYAEAVDDETGELKCGPMLTLVGPDGVYHTMSQYAFRAFQLVAYLRGAPPWSPPLKIVATKCLSRKDRRYQSVLLQE